MRKNGKDMSVMTKQRPGLEYFVSEMSKHYEVIVFNSSVESYSEEMVAKIDPKNRIKYHLYREHCITLNNLCIKNLKLLNRDLTQLVLLDVTFPSLRTTRALPSCNLTGYYSSPASTTTRRTGSSSRSSLS